MRSIILPAAVAIALVGFATPPAAALTGAGQALANLPHSDVIAASESHRRPHYRVRVPRYQQGRVPQHLRGFQDPGYAYHGNINGCVVDLGYGRWESCNTGR